MLCFVCVFLLSNHVFVVLFEWFVCLFVFVAKSCSVLSLCFNVVLVVCLILVVVYVCLVLL